MMNVHQPGGADVALPCPWCGSNPRVLELEHVYVVCANCGACGPFEQVRSEAISAWNRVASRASVERAVLAEREACAKIAASTGFDFASAEANCMLRDDIVCAIRSRSAAGEGKE